MTIYATTNDAVATTNDDEYTTQGLHEVAARATLVVVNRWNAGYGVNEQDPPYLREKRQGRVPESWIRKLDADSDRR